MAPEATAANATVRWLRWTGARPLSDLELAADLARLSLLRRIREEAVEIDNAAKRREMLPPFLRWLADDEKTGAGARREGPEL